MKLGNSFMFFCQWIGSWNDFWMLVYVADMGKEVSVSLYIL